MANFYRTLRIILFVCIITAAISRIALAQSTFGTIVGTVRDPSSALIPGCVVTIENSGTSVKRSTITDEAGAYTVPNLEPGTYKVKLELPGFQFAEHTNIDS